MALLFRGLSGGASDRVEVAAATSINDLTNFGWFWWLNAVAVEHHARLIEKSPKQIEIRNSGAEVDSFVVVIPRAVTPSVARPANGAFVPGTDQCIYITYDEVNDLKIYLGTRTVPLAEVSYAFVLPGVGATDADAANALAIGNRASTPDAAFNGAISVFRLFAPYVSLNAARQYQMGTCPGAVVNHIYGFPGAGTQFDWSGNGNAGTVTGATETAHVALNHPFWIPNPLDLTPVIPATFAGGGIPGVLIGQPTFGTGGASVGMGF